MIDDAPEDEELDGPYVTRTRAEWAQLSKRRPMRLTESMVREVRSAQDPISLDHVRQVYFPLTELINIYIADAATLHRRSHDYLRLSERRVPFVIGVAGSVAVGKSTTSRVLRELLARWPETPRVELVTTDGFLYPNHVLEQRNLMHRKGFPESYDRRALLRFVVEVKSGADEVRAPRYDHLTYDILPGEEVVVRRPDVLIVEGLNVLQPASLDDTGRSVLALPDFFDFSIYVDANPLDVQRWYIERFLRLRSTAFLDPHSYFRRYADLTDEEAVQTANRIWSTINEPNLVQNIAPTRGRATLVMTKGSDHAVSRIRLRKL